MSNNCEETIQNWQKALEGGPGGTIDFDELDNFVGASGIDCSSCTCSSCGSCQSDCGKCTY